MGQEGSPFALGGAGTKAVEFGPLPHSGPSTSRCLVLSLASPAGARKQIVFFSPSGSPRCGNKKTQGSSFWSQGLVDSHFTREITRPFRDQLCKAPGAYLQEEEEKEGSGLCSNGRWEKLTSGTVKAKQKSKVEE